jgi:hypothetical protein
MNKKQKKQVENIINTAFDEAEYSTYCASCVFAYFRPNDITGYCRHDDNRKQMHPKSIDIFHTCQHWTKNEDPE